jgi:hypothetical protein
LDLQHRELPGGSPAALTSDIASTPEREASRSARWPLAPGVQNTAQVEQNRPRLIADTAA